MNGRLRQIPGFRSGTRWKQVLAVVGYAVVLPLIGWQLASGNVAAGLFWLETLGVAWLIANAWGVRSRIPVLNSSKRLVAAAGGVGLTLIGLIVMLATISAAVPPVAREASSGWDATPASPAVQAATSAPTGQSTQAPTQMPALAATSAPTVAPTVAPTAIPTVAPAPRPAVLPYTIATSAQTSAPNRLRWQVDAVIPGEADAAQVAETCAEIARRTLRERSNVLALVVFGYFEASEVNKGFTRCRATLSRDGRGWTGDGKAINGDDKGDVLVDIAKVTMLSTQRVSTGTEATIRLPK